MPRKSQSATSAPGPSFACDKSKTTHRPRIVPLGDSRNRKVPVLNQRGRRIDGPLWSEGEARKVPRGFDLLKPEAGLVALAMGWGGAESGFVGARGGGWNSVSAYESLLERIIMDFKKQSLVILARSALE